MNNQLLLNKLRKELTQTIRNAVEKENNCIGTFYKNKGYRSFLSQIKDEYDNSPVVIVHNTDFIDSYGDFEPADVVDLYVDTESRLMCTVNGISGNDWDEPIEHVQVEGLINIVEWLEANGFIQVQFDNPYRCSNCGSTNVQARAWVSLNDNSCLSWCGDNGDDEDNWCDDCEEHSDLVMEDELLQEIDDWWEGLDIYYKEKIAGLWLYDYNTDDAGMNEFNADCRKFWEKLTTGQKIEKWQTNKNEE